MDRDGLFCGDLGVLIGCRTSWNALVAQKHLATNVAFVPVLFDVREA
jgi:hypothetical protein